MGMLAPIVTAVVAGATAAGTAAVAAISTIGLAQGMMLVGTALSFAGQMTGSKTLTNIGVGFSMAGGISGLASSAINRGSQQAVSGSNSKSTSLLETDTIDSTLAGTTKGSKTMSDLQTFTPEKPMSQSVDAFNDSASKIGGSPFSDSTQEASFLNRAGATLRKYDTAANVLMGMGDAYMQTRGTQAQEDMLDKRLEFEQKEIDRKTATYGAPSSGGSYAVPGIKRVPGIVNANGLLANR